MHNIFQWHLDRKIVLRSSQFTGFADFIRETIVLAFYINSNKIRTEIVLKILHCVTLVLIACLSFRRF